MTPTCWCSAAAPIPAAACGSRARSCGRRRTTSSRKGKRVAALLLQAKPEAIAFAAGRFTVDGTAQSIGLFEIADATLRRTDLPEDLRGPLAAICDETIPEAAFPFGSHVCEVEIDPDLGTLELIKYSAVDDVGRAVNPMIIDGQTHGGIVQGVGQALLEQCFYDSRTGQLLSGSFMDYAMPRADLFPFFNTGISEIPMPSHPLGIRPAGEGGTTPALAVVVNAVVDALERLRRPPRGDADHSGAHLASHARQAGAPSHLGDELTERSGEN